MYTGGNGKGHRNYYIVYLGSVGRWKRKFELLYSILGLYERELLLSCGSQEQAEIKFRDMSKTLVK